MGKHSLGMSPGLLGILRPEVSRDGSTSVLALRSRGGGMYLTFFWLEADPLMLRSVGFSCSASILLTGLLLVLLLRSTKLGW